MVMFLTKLPTGTKYLAQNIPFAYLFVSIIETVNIFNYLFDPTRSIFSKIMFITSNDIHRNCIFCNSLNVICLYH